MNLFIDSTNWNLILLLEKDQQIIDKIIIKNTKKISDFFSEQVNELLTRNNLKLKDLQNLYVTVGPGSYTGVRIGLLFAKTLKTIDDHYQIFTINSLLYQAGMKKAISILDARGGKYFVGVYDHGNALIAEKIVDEVELEGLKTEYNFEVVEDYENLNFEKNFLELKNSFKLVADYNNLTPLYLKKFI